MIKELRETLRNGFKKERYTTTENRTRAANSSHHSQRIESRDTRNHSVRKMDNLFNSTRVSLSSIKTDSRNKVYLRFLMRLTEKFGANPEVAMKIKKVLDEYIENHPNFDSDVSKMTLNNHILNRPFPRFTIKLHKS